VSDRVELPLPGIEELTSCLKRVAIANSAGREVIAVKNLSEGRENLSFADLKLPAPFGLPLFPSRPAIESPSEPYAGKASYNREDAERHSDLGLTHSLAPNLRDHGPPSGVALDVRTIKAQGESADTNDPV